MAVKKKDPYSTQGLNDKASVQQALASAQYRPGEAVNQAASALEQWQSSRPAGYQSQYQGQINSLLDQAMNQEKFSYDYASDPLYRQYAQAYRQNAHDASTDAAAQAAALTGGYGSSYATSAAQQAYQQQMNGLNSVIPTLYGLALDSYTSEGDLLMDQIGMLNQQEQNAQDLYYRQLDDYYTQLEYKQEAYENAAAQDYAQYTGYLANLNNLYGYYTQQEEAEAARRQQTFNNVMGVLGLIGNVAQMAISGTTGLGSMLSGLAQAGYSMYADSRDFEAARADAAWEQQMQERLRQDSLARQSYEDSTAAQQYEAGHRAGGVGPQAQPGPAGGRRSQRPGRQPFCRGQHGQEHGRQREQQPHGQQCGQRGQRCPYRQRGVRQQRHRLPAVCPEDAQPRLHHRRDQGDVRRHAGRLRSAPGAETRKRTYLCGYVLFLEEWKRKETGNGGSVKRRVSSS